MGTHSSDSSANHRARRGPVHRTGERIWPAVSIAVTILAVAAPVALAGLRTIKRADAVTVANAISIRHSDVPTLKQQSNPTTPASDTSGAALTACAGGVPASKAFANTQSPAFVTANDSLTISSETEILPSVALVATDFAAFERPLALTCLHSLLSKELGGEFPKSDKVKTTVARFPSVISGVGKSFGLRFAIVVTVKQGGKSVSVAVYDDVVGFAYGQAEVTLNVQTTLTPPSATLERSLGAALLKRARTALG
ncbi:MAG: hypothetical protein ABSE75_13690 [Acidimicrobiales bacterium]